MLKQFRFHTGSIKSQVSVRPPHFSELFRFHTGSIKSRWVRQNTEDNFNEFRFHTGSIKRQNYGQVTPVEKCFDSILVRLKVL